MSRVKVLDLATRRGIYLDAVQTEMFLAELQRVTQHFVEPEDLLSRTAEDAVITVIGDSGAGRRYRLYGRVVLLDEDNDKVAQFYMGLQLLEWLR